MKEPKTTERAKPRKDEASRKAKPETQGSHTLTISFFAREK